MTHTCRIWVLGAPDPEMQLIEDLLAEAGESVAHALDAGQRVHPGTAYRATALSQPVPDGTTVYAVECGGPAIPAGAVVIDHHRPGDPGYGRGPEEFLPASSVGQVIAELAQLNRLPWTKAVGHPGSLPGSVRWTDHGGEGWAVFGLDEHGPWRAMIPDEIIWSAAADHCLAAAYRGECPGVDPDELMHWRVAVRAAHQGRAPEEVMSAIEKARMALRCAIITGVDPQSGSTGDQYMTDDPATWSRREYADLRGMVIPELPEAACREGVPYLATVVDPNGRQKVVLGGYAAANLVERFMSGELVPGLKDIYGDPARGFAGGYIQQ